MQRKPTSDRLTLGPRVADGEHTSRLCARGERAHVSAAYRRSNAVPQSRLTKGPQRMLASLNTADSMVASSSCRAVVPLHRERTAASAIALRAAAHARGRHVRTLNRSIPYGTCDVVGSVIIESKRPTLRFCCSSQTRRARPFGRPFPKISNHILRAPYAHTVVALACGTSRAGEGDAIASFTIVPGGRIARTRSGQLPLKIGG